MTSMTVPVARGGQGKHPGFGRMAAMLRRLGERYRTATALRQLETMSDWQLKDVGFDRCGIRHGVSLRRRRSGHAHD